MSTCQFQAPRRHLITSLPISNHRNLSHLTAMADSQQGELSWRISSHPVTLLTFLGFRVCTSRTPAPLFLLPLTTSSKPSSLPLRRALHRQIVRPCSFSDFAQFLLRPSLPSLHQPYTSQPASSPRLTPTSVLIFIIDILLLATDFYYLKNIAGRRLVGLRWWNEVDTATGNSTWIFESAEGRGDSGRNKTDSRFFWLALYVQPAMWAGLGILGFIKLKWVWLTIDGKF